MKKLFYTVLIMLFFLYGLMIGNKIISSPRPFVDWDESIYMQVGKEMIENTSALPLWLGGPWLEKPPLVPIVYGLVAMIPYKPEITTRIFSLAMSLAALVLIFLWAKKIFRDLKMPGLSPEWLALATCVVTAFNPVFLKRTQEVNTDVWLLIGWLGYLLTYPRFGYSLFFLFIGVFSKSLLGLYPLLITFSYELFNDIYKKKNNFKKYLIFFGIQFALMMIWYLIMITIFRSEFVKVHFMDHLVSRVTKSIESHFGKRTFYLDIIVVQYGWYLLLCGAGLLMAIYRWWKNKQSMEMLRDPLFLVPFFLFLNLTKTKITWYIYPVIPGVAILMVYACTLFKNKLIIIVLSIVIIVSTAVDGYFVRRLMDTYYSTENPKYKTAVTAKKECRNLYMLLDGGTREMFITLDKLGLLISTSFTYGNNPAMVYYYGKKVHFYKDEKEFQKAVLSANVGDCFTLEVKDIMYVGNDKNLKQIAKYDWQILVKKTMSR